MIHAVGLTPEKVYELVVNSFNASFISDKQRSQWLQQAKDIYEEVVQGAA